MPQVVLVLCRLRPQCTFSHSRKATPPLLGMVAIAIALPPPSVHEIRLDSDMFVTRINFDFRIAHCEPRVSELLDYTAEELTGKNLYTLCHGEDANRLRKCHLDRKSSPLLAKLFGKKKSKIRHIKLNIGLHRESLSEKCVK